MIDFVQEEKSNSPIVKIKVLGIGGAGGNTIGSMLSEGYGNIELIAANTDAQALEKFNEKNQLKLGYKLTKGLGSGSDPEIGKRAAEEDLGKIGEFIDNTDILFLTAGLGGGTGSGGLPVIAKEAKERNVLSIAVVTKPFDFEGKRRTDVANEALEKIKNEVDTLIVIPNQRLLSVAEKGLSLIDAFSIVNNIISQFVKSVSQIITRPGHINVDFADIKAITKNMGVAVMGTGRASGENRAEEATLQAISSPLLEDKSIKGAKGILLNITGNSSLGLHEVSAAASLLHAQASEDASIVLGSVVDESMGDEISITIIATGFDQSENIVAAQKESSIIPSSQEIDEIKDQSRCAEPEEENETENNTKTVEEIDIENIEIPTILRRMAEEKQTEQQS